MVTHQEKSGPSPYSSAFVPETITQASKSWPQNRLRVSGRGEVGGGGKEEGNEGGQGEKAQGEVKDGSVEKDALQLQSHSKSNGLDCTV